MTNKQRLEAEARERYPFDGSDPNAIIFCREEYVQAKTIKPKQFDIFINSLRIDQATIRDLEVAFRTAGFYVEGDDHD